MSVYLNRKETYSIYGRIYHFNAKYTNQNCHSTAYKIMLNTFVKLV